MTSFLHLSNKRIQIEEKEEAVLLEVEKPKVEEKKEKIEGEEGGEEEQQMEEPQNPEGDDGEEGKPKFKPEGMMWTNYDGNPRNHVQVVSRFTKYPIKECNTTLRNLENTMIDILNNDIKTKEGKINLINY